MEKQPPKHGSRRKDPKPTKAPAGESLAEPPKIQTEMKPPTTHQPDAMTPSTTPQISTEQPATTAVVTIEPRSEPDPEQIMKEFLQRYGGGSKASEIFARMAAACQEVEATATITPLEIPVRPPTFQETPIAQTLTFHRENPQTLTETLPPITSTPASDLPLAEEVESPREENIEGAERESHGSEGGEIEERDEGIEVVEGGEQEGEEGGEQEGEDGTERDEVESGEVAGNVMEHVESGQGSERINFYTQLLAHFLLTLLSTHCTEMG